MLRKTSNRLVAFLDELVFQDFHQNQAQNTHNERINTDDSFEFLFKPDNSGHNCSCFVIKRCQKCIDAVDDVVNFFQYLIPTLDLFVDYD